MASTGKSSNDASRNEVFLRIPAMTTVKTLLIASLFVIAALLLEQMAPLASTFAISIFLAVAADQQVRWLQRSGLSRGLAVTVFMLGLIGVIMLIAWAFIPPLVDQTNRLIAEVQKWVIELQETDVFNDLNERFDIVGTAVGEFQTIVSSVSGAVVDIANSVLRGVFGLVMIIFLVVFMLMSGGDIVRAAAAVYPNLTSERGWGLMRAAYRNVGGYVTGITTTASISAVTLLIVLTVLGVDFAFPLALWMFMMSFVPMVGATIGSIPSILVALASQGWVIALVIAIYIGVYQQLEGAVIQPKIIGRNVQLSAFFVFVSVIIGGQLFGIVGALMAIPIAGIIQAIAKDIMEVNGQSVPESLPPLFDVDDQGSKAASEDGDSQE